MNADSELHGEGTWTMPGGKLDFGESFMDAATPDEIISWSWFSLDSLPSPLFPPSAKIAE